LALDFILFDAAHRDRRVKCSRYRLGIYTLIVQPIEESVDWHRFLARPRLPVADSVADDIPRGKSILVTGAGGSIGSALAVRLAKLQPHKLVLLEASESNLHELQPCLYKGEFAGRAARDVVYLGSVTDEALLDEIFAQHQPDWIFHAAAHKHVPLLEDHPLAALANNVLGTHALCMRAEADRSRMVLLSTDKAVAPTSMMGATKRVAELIVLAMGGTAVRLGNVLASRGSVVETFTRQIAQGKPITITDPEAARFWLTVEESIELLISAAAETNDSATDAVLLVPDLVRTHLVGDLAKFVVSQFSPDREILLEFIGLGPGEKKLEVLWAEGEEAAVAGRNGLRRIHTQLMPRKQLEFGLRELRLATGKRDLTEAVAALQSLVPDYSPSQRVIANLKHSSNQVQA
jgi:FlaA1/EpsC-like NDP-sugar epimerase